MPVDWQVCISITSHFLFWWFFTVLRGFDSVNKPGVCDMHTLWILGATSWFCAQSEKPRGLYQKDIEIFAVPLLWLDHADRFRATVHQDFFLLPFFPDRVPPAPPSSITVSFSHLVVTFSSLCAIVYSGESIFAEHLVRLWQELLRYWNYWAKTLRIVESGYWMIPPSHCWPKNCSMTKHKTH